ncbi:hypothetical protein [Enterococcus faecalis]
MKENIKKMVISTIYNLEILRISFSESTLTEIQKDKLLRAYQNQIAILEILDPEEAKKYYTTTFFGG